MHIKTHRIRPGLSSPGSHPRPGILPLSLVVILTILTLGIWGGDQARAQAQAAPASDTGSESAAPTVIQSGEHHLDRNKLVNPLPKGAVAPGPGQGEQGIEGGSGGGIPHGHQPPIAPLRVLRDPVWDTIVYLEGSIPVSAPLDQRGINTFLKEQSNLLRVQNPQSGWLTRHVGTDSEGYTHVVAVRTHQGVEVVGSELALHFKEDPDQSTPTLVGANGHYLPDLELSVIPAVPQGDAVNLAEQATGAPGGTGSFAPARLVIIDHPTTGEPRLAWEVMLKPIPRADGLYHLWQVYVDAIHGAEVRRFQRLKKATQEPAQGTGQHELGHQVTLDLTFFSSDNQYAMQNMVHPGGKIVTGSCEYTECSSGRIITSSTTQFDDSKAVSLHDSMLKTMTYYHDTHGRNGWNGRGGMLKGNVHFDRQYANAFWDPNVNQMFYGDGNSWDGLPTLTACVDIVAHEFGHAVVQSTVDLVYESESGALNEHFADWSGAMVDTANRWHIGEHCANPSPLRNMGNPGSTSTPLPGHMNQYQRLPNTEEGDYGGVHINVGIVNRALYLAAQDVDLEKIEKIWYRVLDSRLITTRARFLDFVRGVLNSSTQLYPDDLVTKVRIQNAFAAVGLGEPGVVPEECPENSSYRDGECHCDPGYQPNSRRNGCEPIPEPDCPANSSYRNGNCYCDPGYELSPDQQSCIPISTQCPPNSHPVDNQCVCDPGFVTNRTGDGCVPEAGTCPENSTPGSRGECVCNDGYWMDESTNRCIPETGAPCGEETHLGRCVGTVLIYCDDKTDPDNPVLVTIDCADNSYVCGTLSGEVGYHCVDDSGDDSSGSRCPANSSLNADGHCECNEGWVPSPDGNSCVSDSPLDENQCPPNASWREHLNHCTCDQGFKAHSSGNGCIPLDGCPPNSHYSTTRYICICDPGYMPNSTGLICVSRDSAGAGCGCALITGATPAKGDRTGNGALFPLLLLLGLWVALRAGRPNHGDGGEQAPESLQENRKI